MMRLFRAVGRWLTERVDSGASLADRLAWMTAESDAANADIRRVLSAIDRVNVRADRPAGGVR
jgi:hypothetical protein